jgi:A/G-specific adenine glycosylase
MTSNLRVGFSVAAFQESLLAWYDRSKRVLPWRGSRDPYRIWLSEIMLQQTRVAAVLDHYQRFLRKFPTVRKLAAARTSTVLAAWSGLGYYRRARMLHAAARQVIRDHAGHFPDTVEGLRSLPGIGRYTAAAVASIAFNRPAAVVDGNVERILQRFSGEASHGETLWKSAQALLSLKRPGDFNQAMMELGATVCVPRQPKCLLCPIASFCATRGELPDRPAGSPQRKRSIQYVLSRSRRKVLLVQRNPKETLMPGMWELPEYEHSNGATALFTLRHSITNTAYQVGVIELSSPEIPRAVWVEQRRVPGLPLTGLARKILRRAGVI